MESSLQGNTLVRSGKCWIKKQNEKENRNSDEDLEVALVELS